MLTKDSPYSAHLIQNLLLLWLSIALLPLSTAILLLSYVARPWAAPRQSREALHSIRSSASFRPRTILVTGVGMTKGLALARMFHSAGHRVIGADFETPSRGVFVCGRMSRAVHKFYPLRKPDAKSSKRYVDDLLDIIRHERVDLWVSCSGVASAVSDGEAKEVIESATTCKCVQFDVKTTATFHEKNTFIARVRELGLTVPETVEITSTEQLKEFFDNAEKNNNAAKRDQANGNTSPDASKSRQYITKTVAVDDANRGDMTLLPRSTPAETAAVLKRVNASPSNPWIVQQFISGSEYCTHSLVVRGRVLVFVACPSAELLMHYEALPTESALSRAMLAFTEKVAKEGGEGFTGHLSFDFLIESADLHKQDPNDVTLYPIECNPRAHTAVALFNYTPGHVEAYLSLIDPGSSKRQDGIITPARPKDKYYWVGHDLVASVLSPVFEILKGSGMSGSDVVDGIIEFVKHVTSWRDGTWEVWDPLPFWWLYHVYWPAKFVESLIDGQRWSRLNVSTTKMFVV